jgi:hypothetical protein
VPRGDGRFTGAPQAVTVRFERATRIWSSARQIAQRRPSGAGARSTFRKASPREAATTDGLAAPTRQTATARAVG